MKFETIPPVETQPPAPDESQRVEDVAKAQEMAEAGDHFRNKAAETRKAVEEAGGSILGGWGDSVARTDDQVAEIKEDRAAQLFELKKQYPDMSDEEIGFMQWKQSEKRTPEEIRSLFKEKFGREF